ncbi:hypothetical protein [Bacteroides acidifaciens]|uniref:hypothetical protein n=1 Tax=Bacteroides acidifaciens TaxID=85831 RepID=UPI00131F1CE3|nr:hypothetical protein [Bacteroides acidifaciens]MCR1997899.1 hypothetical protein [Bacteroides acidifaciens]
MQITVQAHGSAAGMASHSPGIPIVRGRSRKHGTRNKTPLSRVYAVEALAFSML